MKRFDVRFEIFSGSEKEFKTIQVEAADKKLAMLRAMREINKIDGYSELYKVVRAVKEVE